MTFRTLAVVAVVTAALSASAGQARAQTPAQAETLNEEGKTLYKNKDFSGAAKKFRDAIAISPEARFYFNLCATLEKSGDYDGAIEACDEVYTHTPTDELKGKTGQRAAEIRAKKRKAEQDGGGNGGTGNPDGNGGNGGTGNPDGNGGNGGTGGTGGTGGGGTPPEEQIEEQVEAGLNYKWGLGAEIGPVINKGYTESFDSSSGFMVKLFADYLVSPRMKIGARAYLDIANFAPTGFDDGFGERQLGIVDLGIGLYKHLKLANNIYLHPLVGVHLATLRPYQTTEGDSFGTLGFRLEAGIDWVLSEHHVLNVVPFSMNYYLPAGGVSTNNLGADVYGFDQGGALFMITIGYSYRSTKLVPGIVTLE